MSEQEAARLLADESFINYCLGRNANDTAHWEAFLSTHPHEKENIEELKAIVLLTSRSVNHREMQAQLERLKQQIDYRETVPVSRIKPNRSGLLWKVAATVSGILLAGMLTLYYFSGSGNTPAPAVADYATHKAERKSFFLPDGSKVTLNAESTISLSDQFNKSNRVVELSGEAFFDVVHDASKPFVVKTSTMDVRVLGTAFNVKAYKGDATSETSLIRGSVELSLKNENRKIKLSPNEKYLLRKPAAETTPHAAIQLATPLAASGLLPVRVSKKDTAIVEVSWTENKLVFVDEPFEELAKQLSRWYGVNIEITDPSLKNIQYTASFRNEDIEDVLAALQFTKAFTFERKNDNIMIYP
ncbi:MAG: FecR family protein [Agriterribacter sp.]